MRSPWWSRLAFSVATLAAPLPLQLHAQDSLPSLAERIGTFRSKRLRESSGVAVSRRHAGILWTHNDSGDGPFLYAITSAGELVGTWRVPNARNVDWEDIGLGTCPQGGGACLYVADTGDNSERRKSVSVYIVPEPDHPSRPDTGTTAPAQELRIRYPDRPHDVEALLVGPRNDLTLITKGWRRAIIRYSISHESFKDDSIVARLVDTLPIVPVRTLGRVITGGAISPSKRRAVLRTYSELYFYSFSKDGSLVPDGKPCWLGAAEPQGEGVDFLDEQTVVLTSESLPNQDGSIYRVRCSSRPGGKKR